MIVSEPGITGVLLRQFRMWMKAGCGDCVGSDITFGGDVYDDDLAEFTNDWLYGK